MQIIFGKEKGHSAFDGLCQDPLPTGWTRGGHGTVGLSFARAGDHAGENCMNHRATT